MIEDAAGKDGKFVVRRSRSGAVATPKKYPKQTTSARRSAANVKLGDAAIEFTNLSDAQIQAWNDWGATRRKTNDVNGTKYAQTGVNAYVELATVFKMASPGVASPLMPPTTSFSGDSLTFSTSVGVGHLTVTGSGATSNGTKLEVMLQKLNSRACRPGKDGYVSQGFFALTSGEGFEAEVPASAGTYAIMVRYVRVSSGQATTPQFLGKVTVALSIAEGGVDEETGEVVAPVAKPVRQKKAA